MRLIEIIKRFAPFFLTFAIGLFVASFFVSVAAPRFSFEGRQRHNCRRINQDYQSLRERNDYLERRNAQLERQSLNLDSGFENSFDVPPPPPVMPVPMKGKLVYKNSDR